MNEPTRPDWVERTLKKYVGKKTTGIVLPKLNRNMQAEILRIQAVIDIVTKHNVPESELVRLRNKTQDLLNLLNSRQ